MQNPFEELFGRVVALVKLDTPRLAQSIHDHPLIPFLAQLGRLSTVGEQHERVVMEVLLDAVVRDVDHQPEVPHFLREQHQVFLHEVPGHFPDVQVFDVVADDVRRSQFQCSFLVARESVAAAPKIVDGDVPGVTTQMRLLVRKNFVFSEVDSRGLGWSFGSRREERLFHRASFCLFFCFILLRFLFEKLFQKPNNLVLFLLLFDRRGRARLFVGNLGPVGPSRRIGEQRLVHGGNVVDERDARVRLGSTRVPS